MFSLEGMTAAITGGTSGIGEAVAARIVAARARVVLIGRREGAEGARKVGAVAAVHADRSPDSELARARPQQTGLPVETPAGLVTK